MYTRIPSPIFLLERNGVDQNFSTTHIWLHTLYTNLCVHINHRENRVPEDKISKKTEFFPKNSKFFRYFWKIKLYGTHADTFPKNNRLTDTHTHQCKHRLTFKHTYTHSHRFPYRHIHTRTHRYTYTDKHRHIHTKLRYKLHWLKPHLHHT